MRRHLPLLLLLLPGCPRDPGDSTPGDDLLEIAEPQVRWSTVASNVPRFTWSTPETVPCRIEIGRDDDFDDRVVETAAGRSHEIQVLGLKASTTYSYRVVAVRDGGEATSTAWSFTTPDPDPNLPFVTVDVYEPDASANGYTLTAMGDGEGGHWLVALDAEGAYSWWYPLQEGDPTFTARLRRALDNQGFVLHVPATTQDEGGEIRRIADDGTTIRSIPFLGTHTDFVEVEPNAVFASLRWDVRIFGDDEGEERHILGGKVVEVDADGNQRTVWDVFEWLDLRLDQEYPNANLGGDELAEDWVHLNGIWYDAGEDVYYVTARYVDSLFKIDRGTGDLLWTLGGPDSDFASEQEKVLSEPHSVIPIEGGVSVFEYQDQQSGGCSAASDILLDTGAWTASQVWQYATESCQRNVYFGNAQPLWNGNRALVLSWLGLIDEVAPGDNHLVRRWSLQLGTTFGFADRIESFDVAR